MAAPQEEIAQAATNQGISVWADDAERAPADEGEAPASKRLRTIRQRTLWLLGSAVLLVAVIGSFAVHRHDNSQYAVGDCLRLSEGDKVPCSTPGAYRVTSIEPVHCPDKTQSILTIFSFGVPVEYACAAAVATVAGVSPDPTARPDDLFSIGKCVAPDADGNVGAASCSIKGATIIIDVVAFTCPPTSHMGVWEAVRQGGLWDSYVCVTAVRGIPSTTSTDPA